MAPRSVMESGWQDNVYAATDQLFNLKLGPAIRDDAKRYAPKLTGYLAENIDDRVENHDLIVEAAADYAAYVELGHRVAHGPQMSEVGPKVVAPQPFLRPALYQERSD